MATNQVVENTNWISDHVSVIVTLMGASKEHSMGCFVRPQAVKTRQFRRDIGEVIRQFVAVLVSLALPGTSLPADSLRPGGPRAPQTRSLHALLPPDGLDASLKSPGLRAGPSSTAPNAKSGAAYTSVASTGVHNSLRASGTPTTSLPGVVPPATPAPPIPPSNISTISSNFNGTSIAAGNYIWFNSVMKVSGVPSAGATITVSGATVQFTANNVAYNLPVPDSVITFSSSASSSTTTFDAVHNQWNTTVPVSYSANVFLAGLSEYLSTALPGGVNPVNWTATFYTDKSGVSLQWQWAAAVYTSFNANYSSLGVKPIDATSGSAYLNSDHAGTPENYKSHVTGGARGGGGSNWTGSYSGTASVTPQLSANHTPVANAGANQTVFLDTTLQLKGSGSSDGYGDHLTYRLVSTSAPQGSTVTRSNPNIVNPTFVTNEKGTSVVQLIVNDGTVDSAPSQVTSSNVNSPPVANAGTNQTLVAGTTVQLNGSGSTDIDGYPLTYSWAILSTPQGSTATLSSATIVNPTFFADKGGTYVVQLIVNDGTVNSQPSTVTITSQNAPPVANAGPNQTVPTQTTVQLDGSKSTDANGDSLTYQWSLVTLPLNSHAVLSNPTIVNPTLV